MRIEINFNQPNEKEIPKRRIFLKAESILKYLISDDEEINKLILCKPANLELVTNDYEIYLAMGSLQDYDPLKRNKLTKFFEQVSVNHQPNKPVLTDKKVEELRKSALNYEKSEGKND